MLVEITEDKFGDIMKAISCMEDKLHIIKDLFEDDAIGVDEHINYRRGKSDRYPKYESRYEPEYRRY